jgi:hypothetical protein
MVIIKGVKTFQNNASVEYSDLDIMQMMGRAVSIYVLCIDTNLINTAHRVVLNLVLYSLDLGNNLYTNDILYRPRRDCRYNV